jgi:hypothetical protein
LNVLETLPDERSVMSVTPEGGEAHVTLCVTPFQLKFTVPPTPISTLDGSNWKAPFAPTLISAALAKVFVTVICASAVFCSTFAVTVAVPLAVAVTVTDEPFAVRFATPDVGLTVQDTVLPESEFPLASFGVAVMVVVSLGLSRAVLLESETLLTAAGGGGFVVPPPPSLPPPPHATNEQRRTTEMCRSNRIGRMLHR